MSFCAWSDSGLLVRFWSDVSAEPSSAPIKPNDTSTTTPHVTSTRLGRRVAASASRPGPNRDLEPAGRDVADGDRFDDELLMPGS
jgi:hypothetical protein